MKEPAEKILNELRGANEVGDIGVNEEEDGGNQAAMNNAIAGMNDQVNNQPEVEGDGGGQGAKTNLSEEDIRSIWISISKFNKSEVILEKKNSKDNFMNNICDALDRLKLVVNMNPQFVKSQIHLIIPICQAYIDNKNPWMPLGKRRKRAVIALKNNLEALESCNDQQTVFDAIAMYETFGGYREAGQINHGVKEEQSTSLRNLLGDQTKEENKYAGKIAHSKKEEEIEAHRGQAILFLGARNAGAFSGGANKNEQNNITRQWGQDLKSEAPSERGRALDPIMKTIKQTNLEGFGFKSPEDLTPNRFASNYRIMKLAVSAEPYLDDYYKFLLNQSWPAYRKKIAGTSDPKEQEKIPKPMGEDEYDELVARINLFKTLMGLYDSLAAVILDPKYNGFEVKAFNMLRYSAADIERINEKNKGNTTYQDTYKIMQNLADAKKYMETMGFRIGDDSMVEQILAAVRKK